MPDVPTHSIDTHSVHIWEIRTPCDAKTFALGVHLIHQEMQSLGFDLEHDDSYMVEVTDEAILIKTSRTVDAEKDFALSRHDLELGRWRHSENPRFVVYPDSQHEYRCLVLDETTGKSEIINDGEGYLSEGLKEFVNACEAYFSWKKSEQESATTPDSDLSA